MPNRPSRSRIFNPIYSPVRLPNTVEREFLPTLSCNVLSSIPANNQNPITNLGSSGGQYYGLLQFDLTGFVDALTDFVSAGLLHGSSGGNYDNAVMTIGVMKPADIATWTNSATYATKDGAAAWTGGSGGFRQPSTEISFTTSSMPGVTLSSRTLTSGEGSYPTRGLFHARYMSTFPYAAFANLLDTAIADGNGKINLYVYSAAATWQPRQGSSTGATSGERMRMMVWNVNNNPGLGWYGAGDVLYPPLDVYATALSTNTRAYGYPYFDMCSVDPSNVTRNWHGGSSRDSTFSYNLSVTGAGASNEMCLLHFDLSEFIGRTFSSVLLRVYNGHTGIGGGTTTNCRVFVAQAAQDWAVGDGNGASSTSGPTWTLKEKNGTVAWAGAINVGSAAFIDTVGQAETTSTNVYGGSATTAFSNVHEIDITAMANRALTTYAGHLRLRIRATSDVPAAGGAPQVLAGPTGAGLLSTYNAAITQSTNATIAGYRTFPHLKIKTTDPVP